MSARVVVVPFVPTPSSSSSSSSPSTSFTVSESFDSFPSATAAPRSSLSRSIRDHSASLESSEKMVWTAISKTPSRQTTPTTNGDTPTKGSGPMPARGKAPAGPVPPLPAALLPSTVVAAGSDPHHDSNTATTSSRLRQEEKTPATTPRGVRSDDGDNTIRGRLRSIVFRFMGAKRCCETDFFGSEHFLPIGWSAGTFRERKKSVTRQ
mmetsp:Transcript_19536/g.45527  ORF Transcript_19536/g.45527 Transcript_19536/m.45527 type:complete len:208 (-) Transcript_19536:37-660(-)